MERSYNKILEAIRNTILSPMAEGVSPEEIKQFIVHLLSPYFVNQDVLSDLAVDVLAPEAVNLVRISRDAWAKDMFLKVLAEYQKAANLNKDACFAGCASWYDKIIHASAEFVSTLNLEIDLAELSLTDFKYAVFRDIGALIEANLQPYLRELLLQNRICRGKTNPAKDLEILDFGVVVNELYQHSGYSEFFAPPPWGIRLNQWRNMAQHYKTRVEGNKIIGTYGRGSNEQEIVLTREELLNVIKRIYSILSVIKGARSIFVTDYSYEIEPYITNITEIRAEVKIFSIASGFATQGFDLQDIFIEKESVTTIQLAMPGFDLQDKLIEKKSVTAILKDVADPPPNENQRDYIRKRIIHTAQFICLIWSYFPVDVIKIEHFDRQGNLRCKIKGKGSDCETDEAMEIGGIPLEKLEFSQ